MKILLLGGKGLIGRNFIQYCINNNLEFVCHDFDGLEFALRNQKYTICINFSGAANVQASILEPVLDFQKNTVQTLQILELIRLHQPTVKFVNLSSAAIYGNPLTQPVQSKQIPAPLSPYGFHKLLSEKICEEYYSVYQIQTCSLRIFSTYGPFLQKQLFWDLYQKALSGKTIILGGTGSESRDFIYIKDLCRAIHIIATNGIFCGEPINVANGEEITIRYAASVFVKKFGKDHDVQFSGIARIGEPTNWKADITELKKWNYKPETTFEKGIELYVKWLKEGE